MESSHKLIAYVDEKLTKPYDICDLSSRYACDLISASIFNVDGHCFKADQPEILEHSQKVINEISRSFSGLMPTQKFPKESSAYLKRVIIDSIRHKSEMSYKRDDLMTHILDMQQRKGFNEDEMTAQVWMFMMESIGTSANVLSFMLYELAQNEKNQDKLRQEIAANVDFDQNQMKFNAIMDLKFLDQVFYETLRLHPPMMYTTRICAENYDIDGAKGHKFQMRKGDVALVPIYSIHRDSGKFRQ